MVGKDGDLLDELFDESLIELCDFGFLLGDEVLQLLDPVHGFFPVVAVNLRLFLLVAEPENFIGDSVVVLFVVGFLDELLLQLREPFLNAVRREGIGADHGLGNIRLKLLQEGFTLGQNSVDCLERNLLQQKLVDRAVLAGHFSLGMKQRLGLGMAMITNPDLLILDEPTNGLDPDGIKELLELITNLKKSGMTILLSSHQLHEVSKVADHIVILHNGEIFYDEDNTHDDDLEKLFFKIVHGGA